MPFFLVGRSRGDLSLTLLSTEVFDTRDLAARAVQAVAISGDLDVDAVDVFIADLGTAAPVVLVGLPAPVLQEDQVAAGVWETTESQTEPVVEPEDDFQDVAAAVDSIRASEALTAALERATSSMAAEGIVPPESVGFAVIAEDELTPPLPVHGDDMPLSGLVEDEPIGLPVTESHSVADVFEYVATADVTDAAPSSAVEDEGPVDDLSAVIASLSHAAEPIPAPPVVTDSDESAEQDAGATDESWPWLNVEVVDDDAQEPPVSAETPREPASVFEPTQEPEPAAVLLADDSLIVSQSLTDEEADDFSPQPVIMGDYADAPVVPEAPAVLDVPAIEEAPVAVYEPAGDLSLANYSCADCIYSNTCPKVNESTPAECGSFQWKAV